MIHKKSLITEKNPQNNFFNLPHDEQDEHNTLSDTVLKNSIEIF